MIIISIYIINMHLQAFYNSPILIYIFISHFNDMKSTILSTVNV